MRRRSLPLQLKKSQLGVTLVELVVVILLLGILATGLTSYLRIGATMVVDATAVQQTLQQSRFALERVVRELRGAVPNSVRVLNSADNSISCVEFTPLVQSGVYRDLPLYPDRRNWIGITTFNSGWTVQTGQRLSVYPTNSDHIYDLAWARTGVVAANQAAMDDGDGNANTRRIRLDDISGQLMTYITESPQKRFYLLNSPVSFCLVGQQLRRYSGYGFSVAQPLPPTPPGSLGDVIATGLTNQSDEPAFLLNAAVLNRNAVLHLFWRFSPARDVGQDLFFNHEVHIPNVP
ncbi:prepilin-type N-terminal cleavage/methylation domain-containing protein [Rheinheimera riviphila]|uniref:Prepilin-type N-terminal cleavage/methylation domain-containing protein n=1 Tax=Rheinheimera riviphila TaxID=1834037 RepID=A0A437QET7_9GAMM|nr:prepilin-type N-terminal cleavage/methylation domain-containing protein [Rheinheimera riviphila]RVU33067.1 prepilin-type N-terminal cleavage/methylation domain-containing protein [Rheinheimera riviphila]